MFVFDSHAHIIPPLNGASGYHSKKEHLRICQRAMHEHLAQPARRVSDNAIVEKRLWNPNDSSLAGWYDVGFRVGTYGRFVWSQDGEECYIQYLPPYVEKMAVSPEMMKAMMDYAQVSAAVLQCGSVYGKLNRYYRKFMNEKLWAKNIFYPLARIDEKLAYTTQVLDELQDLFSDGLLKGLWFAGDVEHFSSRYDEFWRTIRNLDIPVFILFYPDENWIHVFKELGRWAMLFADIRCVLAQSFPLSPRVLQSELTMPQYTESIIKDGNIFIEIVYPIGRGAVEEYPYPISLEAVKKLYQTFGPNKLVWGSDMPMVERYCTYTQSLHYLLNSEIGITHSDMELIVGKNLQRILSNKV